MTKIGIDALFLKSGIVGGAEFMLKNVVAGLLEVSHDADRMFVFCTNPWDVEDKLGKIEWLKFQQQNRFIQSWRSVYSYASQLDTFLFPNYFTPPILPKPNCRFVTVIHDLQYLHFQQYVTYKKRIWLRITHEATLRQSDTIVVISDFVKKDLLERYGHRWEAKVKVIPNPISWGRFNVSQGPEVEHRMNQKLNYPNRRFILSVAAQYPHKNLDTLIHAFKLLKRKQKFDDVKLVLVGQLNLKLIGTTKTTDLNLLINELDIKEDVVVTGFVSDADVGHLYKHASLFVFPSLFEGFGMPPVEALGFGLPVLTTNLTSIPEVTQGHAVYLNHPTDPEEMAYRMALMLENPNEFTPTSEVISALKAFYSPGRVGARYYRELLNIP